MLKRLPDSGEVPSPRFHNLVSSLDSSLGATAGVNVSPRDGATGLEPLTPREHEVLDLVRQGLSNREIAHTLWIAESTVKVHVRHVLEKLGAKSRTEAAAKARE